MSWRKTDKTLPSAREEPIERPKFVERSEPRFERSINRDTKIERSDRPRTIGNSSTFDKPRSVFDSDDKRSYNLEKRGFDLDKRGRYGSRNDEPSRTDKVDSVSYLTLT